MERKLRALSRYQALSSLELHTPDQNREAAKQFDALGLAEYEAMECFQRWKRV
jgi:glucosamine-6-phosphate deaminase